MNLGALKCYYTKSKWPSGGVWINFDEFGGSQMLLYKVQMAFGRGSILMNLGALKCYYTKSKWPSGGVWINFDEFGGSQMLLYKVQMAVGRGLDQF